MDDHDVEYYLECIKCGIVDYISYDDAARTGWQAVYYKGYVCPECAASMLGCAVPLTVAQEHRKEKGWQSLIRP